MKILFMGTPDFAATALNTLLENHLNVTGVISQPDKPKNRGMQMIFPPVKEVALNNGIEVFQPETLKDNAILPYLKRVNPDIIIVVAYGKLLPEYVLNFPRYGCINIHASLLPKYRGSSPIQHSILNGDSITGVTSMYMDKGMDTGDMIIKKEIDIADDDTSASLHDKLALLGGEVLIQTLKAIENETVERTPQNHEEASYAPMIKKEDGNIDWSLDANEILCKIKGFYPWPSAFSMLCGKKFKILSACLCEKSGTPGEVLQADEIITIAAGKKSVSILRLQFENKKAMDVKDCLNGNPCIKTGIFAGEKI